MIHLCYSNRTEALLQALVERVRNERAEAGPFAPVRLVVPNRNVETYLKLGLAESLGVAANLEVVFLRRWLARIAELVVPGARLIDARQTEAYLLALFHDDEALATPALGPVRAYLHGPGGSPDAIDRRRAQLAAQLGPLFDEYAHTRSELLEAWPGGVRLGDTPYAETEAWQRALWLALFADDGVIARRAKDEGRPWLSLAQLLAALERAPSLSLGGAVHLVGVSYVARSYHRLLAALGRHLDVRVYTLNPCREFWEDLETAGELRRRRKRDARFPARREPRQLGLSAGDDPFGLTSNEENLPLRLWARPGRENVRLLNELTDGDFDARFVAHRAPDAEGSDERTLLARLQDDVLDRRVPEGAPSARPDDSLSVLACPGLRRELEVVAAEIWRLVKSDPTLRFNDVAVVVPEQQKDLYLSHVGAVFGESYDLPHSVVDLPLGGGHRLGEAIELLVRLPLAPLGRRQLLPLLTHPALMARFPEANPSAWIRLVDELGIFHGADRREHDGTYIARDLYNWDQGLRRLALGALMTGPRSGEEAPVPFEDQAYVPAELPPDEEPAALAFALLARSLIADARFAAGIDGERTRPLASWIEFVRGMINSYLVPADDAEEALLASCLRELDDLEDVGVGDRPVSYRIAAELISRALANLGGTRGQYLAHGVTVASFVPMRAIPFRAVFVVGLGQGIFPSARRRSELDLRGARRRPGDVSPREQDLYMFLETVLCARDRVVLSYVARDELTGERLAPSSVLLEMREILSSYLPGPELRALFVEAPRPPLRRHDDEARAGASRLARRERAAQSWGRSLRRALPDGAPPLDVATLRRTLPDATFQRLVPRLGLVLPPTRDARARRGDEARLSIPLSALRQFLEDPLQGSARFRLRLREVEAEAEMAERDEEPFESDGLSRMNVLRPALMAALLAEDRVPSLPTLLRAYEAHAEREELSGRFPTGFFREAARPSHAAALTGWREALGELFGDQKLGAKLLRFGRASEHEQVHEVRAGIPLDVRAPDGTLLPVEVVGRTELLIDAPGAAGSLYLGYRPRARQQEERRKHKERLRLFLDHVALSAAGAGATAREAFLAIAEGSTARPERRRFRPLPPERARAWLTDVIEDLLAGTSDAVGPTGVHAYLLPCEAVFEAEEGKKNLVEAVEDLREAYFERPNVFFFSSVRGPVPDAVERHEPPPLDEAERMCDRRFGLYFELLEEAPVDPNKRRRGGAS